MLRILVEQPPKVSPPAGPDESEPERLVAAKLRHSGYPFLWGVTCRFRHGVLFLEGTVPTLHLRQMAQELAMHTAGVTLISNDLRVTGSTCRMAPHVAAG